MAVRPILSTRTPVTSDGRYIDYENLSRSRHLQAVSVALHMNGSHGHNRNHHNFSFMNS